VTGINGSSSSVQAGRNDHCRVYTYGDERLDYLLRPQASADWNEGLPL